MYGALRVCNPSHVASLQLSSAHVDALAVVVPIATLCSLDALKSDSQIRCLHGGALTRQHYLHGHTLLALHFHLHQTRHRVSGCLRACLEMPK